MREKIVMQLFDKVHEMAMSSIGHQAVTGRFLKRFMIAFDEFEDQERERGMERYDVVYGMVSGASMILGSTVLAAAKPLYEKEASEAAIDTFAEIVRDMLESNLRAEANKRVDRKDG